MNEHKRTYLGEHGGKANILLSATIDEFSITLKDEQNEVKTSWEMIMHSEDAEKIIRKATEMLGPQGKWERQDIWVGGEYCGGFYHVNCPAIVFESAFYSRWRTNYCPNCGAPMLKGDDDE